MKNSLLNAILAGAVLASVVLGFQNCDMVGKKYKPSAPTPRGNGDFYTGKTNVYAYFDAVAPCSSVSSAGRPFPNRLIQYNSESNTAYLVRDACNDLEPVLIPVADFLVDLSANTISYQGQEFDLQPNFSPFNIMPLACPAPLTRIAASAPTNFIAGELNLSPPVWTQNSGIESSMFGTIEALPRFQVRRNDSTFLEFWRRLSQYVPLEPGRYAVSFLVSQGNTSSATIAYWDTDNHEFVAHVDFATGQAVVTNIVGFPGGVTATVAPYGVGYNLTVFFDKTTPLSSPEIGVAPTNYVALNPQAGQVGDFVYMTAGSVRKVSDYCN